jgi:hypothetical protein
MEATRLSKKKIITLGVAAALIAGILIGARFSQTQKTILTPAMTDEYAGE